MHFGIISNVYRYGIIIFIYALILFQPSAFSNILLTSKIWYYIYQHQNTKQYINQFTFVIFILDGDSKKLKKLTNGTNFRRWCTFFNILNLFLPCFRLFPLSSQWLPFFQQHDVRSIDIWKIKLTHKQRIRKHEMRKKINTSQLLIETLALQSTWIFNSKFKLNDFHK